VNLSLFSYLAVGTVADKIIRPAGAMIIGSIAGILSTSGFVFIKPAIQKFRAHDTCGVNNLHGMPGLLAGVFGIILAIFPAYSLHTDNLLGTCWHGTNRSNLAQVGYQALALGATIVIAVTGGIITGLILRLPQLSDEVPSAYFNDQQHWETPDDFHTSETSALIQTHAEQ
jgi:ammonium transporter Rh